MYTQNITQLFNWIKTKTYITESTDGMIIRCANGLIANAKLANASEVHIIQDESVDNFYFKINENLEKVFFTSASDVTIALLERYRTIARLPSPQDNISQEAFLYYTVNNFRIEPTPVPMIQLNFNPSINGEVLVIKFIN